jgi:hypothetical protein
MTTRQKLPLVSVLAGCWYILWPLWHRTHLSGVTPPVCCVLADNCKPVQQPRKGFNVTSFVISPKPNNQPASPHTVCSTVSVYSAAACSWIFSSDRPSSCPASMRRRILPARATRMASRAAASAAQPSSSEPPCSCRCSTKAVAAEQQRGRRHWNAGASAASGAACRQQILLRILLRTLLRTATYTEYT